MSRLTKAYIAVMAVFFFIGTILAIFTRSMDYTYPAGPVIDAEYVDALRWNYVIERGFYIGFWMAAVPVMTILAVVLTSLKGTYFPKWRQILFASASLIAVFALAGMGITVIKVATGEPSAAVEVIRDKSISTGRKGREEYYLKFAQGRVKVPRGDYDFYDIGDKIVVVRCGGVPLEVQQPEIVTIADEIS